MGLASSRPFVAHLRATTPKHSTLKSAESVGSPEKHWWRGRGGEEELDWEMETGRRLYVKRSKVHCGFCTKGANQGLGVMHGRVITAGVCLILLELVFEVLVFHACVLGVCL